jgi:hypothetical protein
MLLATPALIGDLDIVAIPLGFALGSAVKAAILVVVLVPRVRAIRPAPA